DELVRRRGALGHGQRLEALLHRYPRVGCVGNVESRRQDPDDRVWTPLERDGSPKHGPLGAEAPTPDGVADDDDRRSAGSILLRREETSELRLRADGSQVTRGHGSAVETLWFVVAEQRELPVRGQAHARE